MKNKFCIIFVIGCLSFFSLSAQSDWKKVNRETSATFTGIVSLDGESVSEDDLVALFVGDDCRMVTHVINENGQSRVSAVVQAEKSSETAEIRYWNASSQEIYVLDTTCLISSHGVIRDFPIALKSDNLSVPYQANGSVVIYPTPFVDAIYIRSIEELISVTIVSSIGSVIQKKHVDGTHVIVDASSIPIGVYTVILQYKKGEHGSYQIIKQ